MPPSEPVRWYFSLRSPYSWLTYRDLMAHYPDVAGALRWIPFWEPDERSERMLHAAGGRFPYVAMSRPKHLYMLQDVRRLARARGLSITWPADRSPCWEVAHLAYLVAEAEGMHREFVAAVYRERWERGRDICLPATIAAIGRELGLDPDRLAGAADDERVRDRGTEILLAIDRDGVFGVPFFIRGYDRFWGLDRLSNVVALVRGTAGTERPAPDVDYPEPSPLTADLGHAGGCG